MLDIDMRPMVESIKRMAAVNPSLLTGVGWGTIRSVNPIKLEIANGVIPPSNQVELSPFCKEWKTKRLEHLHKYNVEHYHLYDDHDTGQGSSGTRTDVETSRSLTADRETQKEIPTFTFWRGLQVGDKVCFIRTNDSQKYIVLWRDNQFDLEV